MVHKTMRSKSVVKRSSSWLMALRLDKDENTPLGALSVVLKSCVHPPLVNPYAALFQIFFGQPLYSPDQHRAPDLECIIRGTEKWGRTHLYSDKSLWAGTASPPEVGGEVCPFHHIW